MEEEEGVDKSDDSMIPDPLPPNQPFNNTNTQKHHGNHKIPRALKNLLPYNSPGLKEN